MEHAYLILAHKTDLTFYTLLYMLDYPNNSLFIHMDRKNKEFDACSMEHVKQNLRYATVYFTERTDVRWGSYSLVYAIVILLKKAVRTGKYNYYHLLSGEDLPIQSHESIDNFFTKYNGLEFIELEPAREGGGYHDLDRVRYYHWFQERLGRENKKYIIRFLRKITLSVQKLLHIQRNRSILFMRGSNWFSITDELAHYVLDQEDWIKKIFRYTFCADELFLQTIVYHSRFQEMLFQKDGKEYSCMRSIDFQRGTPWIWREEDYEKLLESDMLFARKFDAKVDRNIIEKIKRYYSGK